MIVDFHIHYAPQGLVEKKLGSLSYKIQYSDGIPSYSYHPRLYRLDDHVKAMDAAGIDRAYLSCAAGIEGDIKTCRMVNDDLYEQTQRYKGRIFGLAHVPPLGNQESLTELERAAKKLGFQGAAMASSVQGKDLDAPELWPFYEKVNDLGLFLFVHPCLAVPPIKSFEDYDLARAVGREFNLVLATIRLINGGVLESFPNLKVIMSHLGGGIAALLPRIRSYQEKEFWGTAQDPRHGKLPPKPFNTYLERIYFDTGGFIGYTNPIKAALLELKPCQLVFGSDYPQEIRTEGTMRQFVDGIRNMDISSEDKLRILEKNGEKILGMV